MKSSFVITTPIATALVLLLLLSWSSEGAKFSCRSVNEYMKPCLPYLMAGSGRPAPACCAGARALKAAAATKGDRRLAFFSFISTSINREINKSQASSIEKQCLLLSAATMKSSSSALAAIALLLLLASGSEAAISCSDVIKDLKPCVTYLVSGSGKPPAACCSGAKALAAAATTTEDKKAACSCIKSTSQSLKIKSQLAQDLPRNCGINLPYSVSPNADCTKIG
ncbi:hypothetical protein L6164_022934 [Bauhinia variegata]|uniref:Uncharacterized protein n=1 Tax=Bauhinia variegata TaxID=167791 RepID=A0ACB9MIK8_BAUVA|nr:hypothetical protein L6164_022934 [Bauhinia variegata]